MDDQTRSEILKTIPYGFYVTGVVGSDGEVNGFTTCWVSQVSFEPQQVVVAVRKDQHTHDLIEQGGVFSLNFLDTEQEDLARKFTHEQAVTAVVVSYYWHFVDVVWIGLFFVIYVLQ